jgi:hypothetical protein
MRPNTSTGHEIAIAGACVALICFFLPWVLVSFVGQSFTEFSGWQLASGATLTFYFQSHDVPAMPILFVIPLLAIGAMVVALLARQRAFLGRLPDDLDMIGGGVISLLILFIGFLYSQQQFASNPSLQPLIGSLLSFEYRIGLYGVALGNLAIIVGSVLNLRYYRSSQLVQAPASPAPRETSI